MSKEAPERFTRAAAAFGAAHEEDPRGEARAYHERLAHWVGRLRPEASEALRLAARCQHIRRWKIPRGDYPMGRAGYHKWRTTLARFHGDEAARILEGAGYDAEATQRVRGFLLKKDLKKDPEMQTLEDAICLVFLEQQFADFAPKHDEEKIVDILQKTWAKMSADGRKAALALDLPEGARGLIERALGG